MTSEERKLYIEVIKEEMKNSPIIQQEKDFFLLEKATEKEKPEYHESFIDQGEKYYKK